MWRGLPALEIVTPDGLRVVGTDPAGDGDPRYAEAYAGLADAYAIAGDWKMGVQAPAHARGFL
jgi:hypothetical protein